MLCGRQVSELLQPPRAAAERLPDVWSGRDSRDLWWRCATPGAQHAGSLQSPVAWLGRCYCCRQRQERDCASREWQLGAAPCGQLHGGTPGGDLSCLQRCVSSGPCGPYQATSPGPNLSGTWSPLAAAEDMKSGRWPHDANASAQRRWSRWEPSGWWPGRSYSGRQAGSGTQHRAAPAAADSCRGRRRGSRHMLSTSPTTTPTTRSCDRWPHQGWEDWSRGVASIA